jgi:FAD/FMN-containing dehydrogenase
MRVRAALAGPEAVARGLALARLPTVRACALVAPSLAGVVEPTAAPASGWLASVELAGDEAAVERDARRAADAHGADDASPGALARLRGLHGATFGPAGLRFRLAVLPSRLASVLEPLARGGGALLVHPASGLVYARFAVASHDGAGLDAAWRAARAAARAGGGDVLLEEVPDWARAARDVFGDPGDGWRLARALKERFDPAGVLNPGRFVGGL